MQKKIIALAVAAVASGAAFAQSNVVISGNLNYQFENISGSNPATNTSAFTAAQAANYVVSKESREGRGRLNENASNIKFAVTEDLGNGLKAMAVIESGIQPTDSAGTGVSAAATSGSASRGGIGSRDTYVGMSGAFGTVVAGRLSVHYNSQSGIDSFGANTGLAASSLAILHGVGGASNVATSLPGYGVAAGGRLSNTVAYVTPTFNGFNATFGYARPNVGANAPDGVQNSAAETYRKESGWTVKANFDNGPMSAFMSYLAHNDINVASSLVFSTANNTMQTVAGVAVTPGATGTVAGTGIGTYAAEVRGFRMGMGYTFPMGLKVGFIYDNTKTTARDDTANAANDYSAKRAAWAIPLSFAFGQHTLGATYGKANNVTIGGNVGTAAVTNNADLNSTGARYWMAGYQYAFSKRTNLSATFARIDNDARAAYDFFSNGAMTYTSGVGAALRGSDPTSVSFGLKHSF